MLALRVKIHVKLGRVCRIHLVATTKELMLCKFCPCRDKIDLKQKLASKQGLWSESYKPDKAKLKKFRSFKVLDMGKGGNYLLLRADLMYSVHVVTRLMGAGDALVRCMFRISLANPYFHSMSDCCYKEKEVG